ncbi:unnamed protein product [Cyprideis torosa]|uniref:Uncharacterized protein n=1 Tax=Cyprideis torosa TaxID=163714 RepID=A0A7R8WLS5_9CRUS|nr:unnamed protein product [Cyprideis torosa]CAG0901924.1 unnamed protein product [Cyprideis torosa]
MHAQVDPQCRETLCLQGLWKIILTDGPFFHAQVDPQWRETLRLQDLWESIR